MTSAKLVKTAVVAGKWQGLLAGCAGDAAPRICVTLADQIVEEIVPTEKDDAGNWYVDYVFSPEHLNEGAQTYLFVLADTKETLASFAVIAGDVLADDLRAEIDLLRAELDMFKRVFRQHCIETM